MLAANGIIAAVWFLPSILLDSVPEVAATLDLSVQAAADPGAAAAPPVFTAVMVLTVLGGLVALAAGVALVLLLVAGSNAIFLAAVRAALQPWLCFRRALRWSFPYLLVGLAFGAVTTAGFMLFVIPGLYMAARYYPWVPAVLFEEEGWNGLGRARDLTAGYRWPIVGALLVIFLVWLIVTGGCWYLGDTRAVGKTPSAIVGILLSTLVRQFMVFFDALLYLRLREINDGTPLPELGRVNASTAIGGELAA